MEHKILTKLSIDQFLIKAKSYVKIGQISQAQKIYQAALQAFPKNIRVQKEIDALKKLKQNNANQNPPLEVIHQLVNLYNQGQLLTVVEQAQALTEQYPKAFIFWNIMGASASQIGMLDKAINAYKKALSLKPDYADAYNNMSVALKDQGNLDEAIEVCNKAILLNPDFTEAYNNLGNALKDQGKLDKAVEAFKKAILLKPNYSEAYNNLANTLKDQGKLDEAIEACNKAILFKPDYANAYNNMGNVLKDQGKLDEAIEAFKKSLLLKPDDADAYNNIGNVLKDQDKLNEAIKTYKKAILLKPNYTEAYSNMGNVLKDQGKLDEAIEAFKKSLLLKPDYTEVYNNLGNALKDQGKLDEAIETFKKTLLLKPDCEIAYNNMGIAFKDQGKLGEAIEAFKKAILLKPDYALAYSNMGNIIKDQGKLDEAIDAFKKAILLKPNFAEAYSNMGNVLKYQGKLDEAIEAHKKALLIKPDYAYGHLNLGLTLLNRCRVKEGLNEYEWRWKTPDFLSQQRNFSQSLWDGKKSLNGKRILLWCEQGIGDTINWSSYLSLVTSQAEHCILECQEKLVPLLERSFPNVEVKPENRSLDKERDDFDFHLPMGSLYKHFIHEITQNTKPKSYLVPDPVRINFWRERLNSLGKGPYIGISWKSSVVSPFRLLHYPPISEWYPILTIPDVTFINLQYTDFADDLTKIRNELKVTVHNFDDLNQYDNIDDMAALCAALDIVMSTKVTPPFISSAVGTSTKIANWRQSTYNTVLTNPVSASVDMYEKDTWEPWDNVFRLIAEDISKLKN